jgi:hypothetical protein
MGTYIYRERETVSMCLCIYEGCPHTKIPSSTPAAAK